MRAGASLAALRAVWSSGSPLFCFLPPSEPILLIPSSATGAFAGHHSSVSRLAGQMRLYLAVGWHIYDVIAPFCRTIIGYLHFAAIAASTLSRFPPLIKLFSRLARFTPAGAGRIASGYSPALRYYCHLPPVSQRCHLPILPICAIPPPPFHHAAPAVRAAPPPMLCLFGHQVCAGRAFRALLRAVAARRCTAFPGHCPAADATGPARRRSAIAAFPVGFRSPF